jgi:hypothetical protein
VTDPDELLNTYQTAMLLGVSRGVLERMRRTGTGPPWIKVVGKVGRPSGAIRYRRGDVEAYREKRTVHPESAKEWRNNWRQR